MAIVTSSGVIKVDGLAVGTDDESKYPVPPVFNVDYEKKIVYVVR